MRQSGAMLVVVALVYACNAYDDSLVAGAGGGGGASATGQGGLGSASGSAGTGGDRAGASTATAGDGGRAGSASAAGGVDGDEETRGGAPNEGGGGAGGEPTMALPRGSGTITYQRWNGIEGWGVGLLPLDQAPTELTELYSLRTPGDGESYGARAIGFLTAPLDGEYRFWIACDNNCELWLGTDEQRGSLKKIAYVAGQERWTDVDEWDRFASQESVAIALSVGKRYSIDVRLKQELGGSHLSVAWLEPGRPGTASPEVIPGAQLSPLPI